MTLLSTVFWGERLIVRCWRRQEAGGPQNSGPASPSHYIELQWVEFQKSQRGWPRLPMEIPAFQHHRQVIPCWVGINNDGIDVAAAEKAPHYGQMGTGKLSRRVRPEADLQCHQIRAQRKQKGRPCKRPSEGRGLFLNFRSRLAVYTSCRTEWPRRRAHDRIRGRNSHTPEVARPE